MKTQGQFDYELDLVKTPNYHDGTARKTWDQLGEVEQWSWNKKRWDDPSEPWIAELKSGLSHLKTP